MESPLQWHKRHGSHVQELCDWMCFPQELASQFANRAGMTDAQVLSWAQQIRTEWQTAKRVPTGSMFDFWNQRWTEAQAKTVPETPKAREWGAPDLTQYYAERERQEAEKQAKYERIREATRKEMAYIKALEEEVAREREQHGDQ